MTHVLPPLALQFVVRCQYSTSLGYEILYKRWCSIKELGDSLTMVLCIVPGCSKRSGRDKVSFYRLPKIVSGRGIKKEQLSK